MNRKLSWTAIANWFRRRKSGTPAEATPRPVERRRVERVAAGVPGKVIVPSIEREADCVVTNISPAGAEIACEIAHLLDTPIVLFAAGLGRFEGHVIWERDGSYGVRFSGGAPTRGSSGTQRAERRRHKRVAANVLAQFAREDGTIVPCVVLDFSISGVSLETNVLPRMGERVSIGGMIGRVVRFHQTGVGIEFVERERDDARFKSALESLAQWRGEAARDEREDDEAG